jgi:FkbM family methyltransferase
MRSVLQRRPCPPFELMTNLEDPNDERDPTLDDAVLGDGAEPSQSQPQGKAYALSRLALRVAGVLPPAVQRTIRTGWAGPLARRMLDLAAPAGRYEVLEVRSGLMKGALLRVDVRKQREMIAGSYESEVQQALARSLGKGQVVYDVGAHLGFFTLLMARLVGDEGRVFALEPDPFMGPALEANVRLNGVTNVSVIRAAAGRSAGRRRFSPGGGSGIGHLADEGELAVEATTIDDLSGSLGSPDLIKVDVEGGELEVLEGARETLAQRKTVLVVELHGPEYEVAATELLAGLGYSIDFVQDDPSQRRHLVAAPAG